MNREARIIENLKQLSPLKLEVSNESHKHAGHVQHLGGAGFTGETHYKVYCVSPLFEGLSRIERHQKVNAMIADEFKTGLHALELKLFSPSEV